MGAVHGGQSNERLEHLDKAKSHLDKAAGVIGADAVFVADVTARQYVVQAQTALLRGNAVERQDRSLAAKRYEHSHRLYAAAVAEKEAPPEIVEYAQREMHGARGLAARVRGDIAKSRGQFEVAVGEYEASLRARSHLDVGGTPDAQRVRLPEQQIYLRGRVAECRMLLAETKGDSEGAAVHAQAWVQAWVEGARDGQRQAFVTSVQNELRRAREKAAPYLPSTRDNDAANDKGVRSFHQSPGGANPPMFAAELAPRAETVPVSQISQGIVSMVLTMAEQFRNGLLRRMQITKPLGCRRALGSTWLARVLMAGRRGLARL